MLWVRPGKTISQCPKEVRSRKTFGHWELDTVVSGRGKSTGCVATFIERQTRMYTAIQCLTDSFVQGDCVWCSCLTVPCPCNSDRYCRSGQGVCLLRSLEATHGLQVYFADPYSYWQRGSNENTNGLLREFSPKERIPH
ncbi:IS30 family transposase [Paenibacillus sp. CF095]|uniref:IS30 family transposase n=1 Tax=Paenibacillus sp. CF095 TaxID=1881033 RepID=UPI00115F95C5